MAGSPLEDFLAGFRRWAAEPGCSLSGDLEDVAGDLSTALPHLAHSVGVADLSQLTPDDLRSLLLEVYPEHVMLADRSGARRVVASLADLMSYLADTEAVSGSCARALRETLDSIAPQFADAVLDPSRWSPAVQLLHAMADDGVDTSNRAATHRWLAKNTPPDDYTLNGWDNVELKLTPRGGPSDLPPVVKPVRLPGTDELSNLAAGAPLMTDLAALAAEVRGEAVLRLDAVDPLLLSLAEQVGLIDETGNGTLAPGPDVGWLDDLTAGDEVVVLAAWQEMFAQVLVLQT